MKFLSPLNEVSQDLFDFFTEPDDSDGLPPLRLRHFGDIIRFHNLGLTDNGDLSLSSNGRFWKFFLDKQGRKLRSDTDNLMPETEHLHSLIYYTRKWRFPLKSAFPVPVGRYTLTFHRRPIIYYVLKKVSLQGEDYGRIGTTENLPTLSLILQENGGGEIGAGDDSQELRDYRLQMVYNIMCRLAEYSPWHLVGLGKEKADTLRVHVELEKCLKEEQPIDHVCLTTGPVVEPVKKTATKINMETYLELRTTHMRQVAVHRTGIRPSGFTNMDALMKRLGAAAVIVDLAAVRHQSAVTLVRNGLGSSKGASYILYNSARLETLLRTFDSQVKDKVYDPLPPVEHIDLDILDDDLDWQLLYGYILPFPDVLHSVLEQLPQGCCGIHQFVRYIENLAGVFSRYYRQKKVLVQQRENLSPVLHARMYLVMSVRQVLNIGLAVLGIEPVDYI